MLYSRGSLSGSHVEKPVLVFLHGLLGSGEDWQPSLSELSDYDWLTIDLPGHGKSHEETCADFDDCCQQVAQTIRSQVGADRAIILIGYSLGARITMYGAALKRFAGINLQGMVLEGGNFGLHTDQEKSARFENDRRWARRFESELIEQVLSDWYQQAVFSSLNDEQRQTLIIKRSANLGDKVASMLLSTSLASQPYLLPSLQRLSLPMHYVCGAKDKKFCQLAEQSGLVYSQINSAGHNVHQEQPKAFAQAIQAFIDSLCKEVRDNNIGNNHG